MKKERYHGFTLIEMMVVLLIISVLVLLFIPNLSKEKEKVITEGDLAIVQAIETQIELAEFNKDGPLDASDIADILGDSQKKKDLYNEHIKEK